MTYSQTGLKLAEGPRLTIPGTPIYLDLPELFAALDQAPSAALLQNHIFHTKHRVDTTKHHHAVSGCDPSDISYNLLISNNLRPKREIRTTRKKITKSWCHESSPLYPMTRRRNPRIPSQVSSARNRQSIPRIAGSGIWSSEGVSAARSPSLI